MADESPDPLGNWHPISAPPTTNAPDPLPGWTPNKGILNTSYKTIGGTDKGDAIPWDVPGGGALPSVTPQPGTGGFGRYVDTSLTPSPNAGDYVPLSRDPDTGNLRFALPNIIRGLTTEGPQLDSQGKLTVPGATFNPETGAFGVTPEAALTGQLAAPSALRFGGREIMPGEIRRELARPPAPTLPDLLQRQRSAPTTDPVTAATIDLLKNNGSPTAIPQPPGPFGLPPVPDNSVRLYHGGNDPTSGGARWVTPDYRYARDWSPTGAPAHYVDVSRDHPAVQAVTDPINVQPGQPPRVGAFNAPEDIAKRLQPVQLPSVPPPATGGGLLNMGQPAPLPQGGLLGPTGNVAPMTQADMQAVAKGHFSPADQAIAAGLRMTPAEGDAIRNPLMKQVPDDPQSMAINANKPVVDAATTYAKPFVGQDMGVDTAMQIDRDLSSRIRATKDPTDRANLVEAQQGVRDAMEQSSVFQQQPAARQAWNQSIKQGQIEDLMHDVGLRDEDKQPAYLKTRIQSMLQNSDTVLRNWSPDEVAELRKQYDSGNISSLKQFGISLVKPLATVTGGAVGSWFSPGAGTFIGSRLGEQGGDLAAAFLRRRAGTIDLTPVSQRLTQNMPAPPAGWTTTSRP